MGPACGWPDGLDGPAAPHRLQDGSSSRLTKIVGSPFGPRGTRLNSPTGHSRYSTSTESSSHTRMSTFFRAKVARAERDGRRSGRGAEGDQGDGCEHASSNSIPD